LKFRDLYGAAEVWIDWQQYVKAEGPVPTTEPPRPTKLSISLSDLSLWAFRKIRKNTGRARKFFGFPSVSPDPSLYERRWETFLNRFPDSSCYVIKVRLGGLFGVADAEQERVLRILNEARLHEHYLVMFHKTRACSLYFGFSSWRTAFAFRDRLVTPQNEQ
jgi:hypothetical protein